MESLQLEARQPALPVLSAHEVAGQFWLQLHLYEEARRAFEVAAQRIGQTPHVRLGLARAAAAGRRNMPAACEQYRALVAWWKDRPGMPPEIAEARAFLKEPQCTTAPAKPDTRR
jgi:hypothetical protein